MRTTEKIKREKTKREDEFNPEGLKFGVWIWYTYENRVAWSEGFRRLLGLEGDIAPSFELLVACIYPEDIRPFYDNVIVVLNDWKPRWVTFRITKDDQTVHTLKCLLEGMPIGCNDVTDVTGVCFELQ
jgi:hypothetical protein